MCWQNWIFQLCIYSSLLQSASEKHKINVPETMNEYLDMSDDEGMWCMTPYSLHSHYFSPLNTKMKSVSTNKCCIFTLHEFHTLVIACDAISVSLTCMFHCTCPNHTVRANVPEILNEESFSNIDEGICRHFASTVVMSFWFSFNTMHFSRTHLPCWRVSWRAFAILLLSFAVHFHYKSP